MSSVRDMNQLNKTKTQVQEFDIILGIPLWIYDSLAESTRKSLEQWNWSDEPKFRHTPAEIGIDLKKKLSPNLSPSMETF